MPRLFILNAILLCVMLACNLSAFLLQHPIGFLRTMSGLDRALIGLLTTSFLVSIVLRLEYRFRGNQPNGGLALCRFLLCAICPIIFYSNMRSGAALALTITLAVVALIFLIVLFCLLIMFNDIPGGERTFWVYGIFLLDATACLLMRWSGKWCWIPMGLCILCTIYLGRKCKYSDAFIAL